MTMETPPPQHDTIGSTPEGHESRPGLKSRDWLIPYILAHVLGVVNWIIGPPNETPTNNQT